MLKVVINRCYGGFGLSTKAIKWLMDRDSPLVVGMSFEQYAGDDEDYVLRKLVYEARPFDEDYTTDLWGNVLIHQESRTVYTVSRYFNIGDDSDKMRFRTHPDLIAVVEALGDEVNTSCSKLKIIELHDPSVTIDTIYISEYDGNEHIAERHRTWP